MNRLYYLGLLLVLSFSMPLYGADQIFVNGKFYTQAERQPWAEAVVVRDGRFAYVGDIKTARQKAVKGAREWDLGGRLVLPGLIDTHAHVVFGSVMGSGLIINNAEPTVESYLKQLRAYAEANPDLPAIFGFGFYANVFGEAGPLSSQLDSVVADKPVVLLDDGAHSAWGNSLAFKLSGIDKNTPDPVPGAHYFRRDASGAPTGFALEPMAIAMLLQSTGVTSTEYIEAVLSQFLPMLPAMGFTTVFDAGMIMATEMGHEALRKLEQKQQLNTRLVTSYSLFVPEQVEGIVEALKTHQKKYRSARISPNTLKIHNDGTTEAESAAQFQPYLNNPDNRGAMILQGEALAELTEKVAAAGFNIHAHALGERAVKETLDAFAKARAKGHKNRFTMAHVELIRPADQGRFGELDITIQTTPVWAAYGRGHARAVLGGERASRIYSYGEALRKGARLTFGSDFPVSNGLQGLNPMVQIESGITRALPGAAVGSGQPLTGSQLSLARMIQGYTIDAAYQLGLEQQVGSIEVGKSADMAVMEQNIFALAPQHIHAAPVYMTLLQGQPVYHAEQAPAEVKSLIKATAAGQH